MHAFAVCSIKNINIFSFYCFALFHTSASLCIQIRICCVVAWFDRIHTSVYLMSSKIKQWKRRRNETFLLRNSNFNWNLSMCLFILIFTLFIFLLINCKYLDFSSIQMKLKFFFLQFFTRRKQLKLIYKVNS